MSWRVAKSLLTLRDQVNARWPNRDKSSDGTIGDASHQATNSDHNPNSAGVVTAMDISHDPAHGPDARKLAESLVASRDPRIKYIISNAQIISSSVNAWQWRPYSGVNAHRHHCHISVSGDAALYDDEKPWHLEPVSVVVPLPPAGTKRQTGITATVWDDAMGAYGPIDHSKPCVSLPAPFPAPRPLVRVIGPKGTATGPITDKGPWYDGTPARPADLYWESGKRPRAETDSNTNGAGIDLNPAMAAAVGIDGKGRVDWEFVSTVPDKPPPPDPVKPEGVAAMLADHEKRITALEKAAPPGKPEGMPLLLMLIYKLLEKQMAQAPGAQVLTDLPNLLKFLQNPVLQKLLSGGAVTLPELLALPPELHAMLTGQGKPLALPPPEKVVEPTPGSPASPVTAPAVQVTGVASVLTILGQLAGLLPASLGASQTTAGILTTAVPLLLTALAPTGIFGSLLGAFRKLVK